MGVNITSIKTSSNGVLQGDSPLDYAFPLLIVQTILVLAVSRFFAFLLKPLRQPKVIAEIIGGIILGPSAFGRNQYYMRTFFPKWSTPILESVASIGLIFFLFLIGLELDLSSIRQSGRRALLLAVVGMSVPFTSGMGLAFLFRKAIPGADKVGYAQFVVFMGVALSITSFPVLARILAELKLLTTRIGETAMAVAAINDVAAWVLLALAIALTGNGPGEPHKSPLISMWVLLLGIALVILMMVVIKPAMNWVARQCSPGKNSIDEFYVVLTLTGVLISGFMTDLIGIHAIFGAFIFGLTIPKGEFAERLIERIEDFVSGLLLPLYFASSGLKTNVAKIRGLEAWGLLVVVIATACAGKIIGTFVVAMMCMIPARESLTLGVLVNTKGLVELIVLNIGKDMKILNDEMFAILVLMALFTTFMTTPIVMTIYKPDRSGVSSNAKYRCQQSVSKTFKDEFRVLACVHGLSNIPSLINLIELTRSTSKSRLKLYIMHLVELTERSSSIMMIQRLRKNGFPFIKCLRKGEFHDAVAFQAYGQLGQVSVMSMTTISALSTMHEDVCDVAESKGVSMIILPFHKTWRTGDVGGDDKVESVGHGWRGVNQRVLVNAPCSVAVLVDRGFGGGSETLGPTGPQGVCILFFGGPDNREALVLGGRMVEHQAVKVTVIRFIEEEVEGNLPEQCIISKSYSFSNDDNMNRNKEKEMDDAAFAEFRDRCQGMVEYMEKATKYMVDGVVAIGQSGTYDLIVVGKGQFPPTMVAELVDRQLEDPELGLVGDVLASSGQGIVSSVLVVQHHDDVAHEEEGPSNAHGPSSLV